MDKNADNQKYNATALILAGGKSSRFGKDKALMEYDNQSVVARLAAECAKVCSEVLIISDTGQKFNLPDVKEIKDNYRNCGPLGGLQAGLAAAKNEICLLMACDMPLLTAPLMECFLSAALAAKCQIAIAKCGDDVEPMFGVYTKSLLPKAEENLAAGRRSLLSLTKNTDSRFFGEEVWQKAADGKDVFFNVNYQRDYENLLKGKNSHSRQTERKDFYKSFMGKQNN